MHQPHQSEPVKSSKMALLSFLAEVWAAVKSVCQPEAARAESVQVSNASNSEGAIFMRYKMLRVRI